VLGVINNLGATIPPGERVDLSLSSAGRFDLPLSRVLIEEDEALGRRWKEDVALLSRPWRRKALDPTGRIVGTPEPDRPVPKVAWRQPTAEATATAYLALVTARAFLPRLELYRGNSTVAEGCEGLRAALDRAVEALKPAMFGTSGLVD
jgi:hypothetical protein